MRKKNHNISFQEKVVYQVLDEVDGERGHDDVKVLEVGQLVALELPREHVHQMLES
jgi:hypothetical protein